MLTGVSEIDGADVNGAREMVLVESKAQAATFTEKLRASDQFSATVKWVIAAANRRLEIRIQTDTGLNHLFDEKAWNVFTRSMGREGVADRVTIYFGRDTALTFERLSELRQRFIDGHNTGTITSLMNSGG